MKQLTCIFILCLTVICDASAAPSPTASSTSPSADERLELEIYRDQFPRISEELKVLKRDRSAAKAQAPSAAQEAYQQYLIAAYKTDARLRELQADALEWQIFAANWLLTLVAAVTLSGLAFAGYQLLRFGSSGNLKYATELEVSAQRLRLQTGVVGVVVLVISCAFLLLFLKDAYVIHYYGQAPTVLK